MRAVNLLPPEANAPRQRIPKAPIVLAATAPVLAGALIYLGASLEHSTVVNRSATLGDLQSQLAALAPSPSLTSESTQVASERQTREAALAGALGKRVAWDVVLDQIARVLPANVWLSTLTAQSPTPAGIASSTTSSTGSPTAMTIGGFTYSQADVAHVLARLALVPSLSNVTLMSTTLSQAGSKQVVQFQISSGIRGAATAS